MKKESRMIKCHFYRFKGRSDSSWSYEYGFEDTDKGDSATAFEEYLRLTMYDPELHEAEYLGYIFYPEHGEVDSFFTFSMEAFEGSDTWLDFSEDLLNQHLQAFAQGKKDPMPLKAQSDHAEEFEKELNAIPLHFYRFRDKEDVTLSEEGYQEHGTQGLWIYSVEPEMELDFPAGDTLETGKYLPADMRYNEFFHVLEYLGKVELPEVFRLLMNLVGKAMERISGKELALEALSPFLETFIQIFAQCKNDPEPIWDDWGTLREVKLL